MLIEAATAALLLVQGPACGPHAAVESMLTSEGLVKTGWGLGPRRTLLFTFYVNERTGNWVLTHTRPNGLTCRVAAGNSWQPQPKGEHL